MGKIVQYAFTYGALYQQDRECWELEPTQDCLLAFSTRLDMLLLCQASYFDKPEEEILL